MSDNIQELRRAIAAMKDDLRLDPIKFAVAWAGEGLRFGVYIDTSAGTAVDLADVDGLEPHDRVPLKYRSMVEAELARVAPNVRIEWEKA